MLRASLCPFLALVLVVGFPAGARADLMTPSGLNPGDQFRIVFVYGGTTPATSPNLATYDVLVSADAVASGIGTYNGVPVTYRVIGSTSTQDAISRLPADTVPIYLPDGTEVAPSGAALWNTATTPLLHAIDKTATGGPGPVFVWTGTLETGFASTFPLGDPSLWTTQGAPSLTDSNWVNSGPEENLDFWGLYGFSTVLTVPQATVVPEPGTITLALAGIGVLAAARLARRRRLPGGTG